MFLRSSCRYLQRQYYSYIGKQSKVLFKSCSFLFRWFQLTKSPGQRFLTRSIRKINTTLCWFHNNPPTIIAILAKDLSYRCKFDKIKIKVGVLFRSDGDDYGMFDRWSVWYESHKILTWATPTTNPKTDHSTSLSVTTNFYCINGTQNYPY